MAMSLLEMLTNAATSNTLTKEEFGRVMHDPNSTEQEIADALQQLQDADGYENLAD